jgi:hypothetical protein
MGVDEQFNPYSDRDQQATPHALLFPLTHTPHKAILLGEWLFYFLLFLLLSIYSFVSLISKIKGCTIHANMGCIVS